ncbi:MAG: SpaA isopeptide-forming pilin-related protein [Clostridium sp.]
MKNYKRLKNKVIAMIGLCLTMMMVSTSVAQAFPVDKDSGLLSYVKIQHPKYKGSHLKTFRKSSNTDGRTTYCLDFLKNTPTDDVQPSTALDDAFMRAMKAGYPYVSFTGDADVDYYITQTAVYMLRGHFNGYDIGLGPEHLIPEDDFQQNIKNIATKLMNDAINGTTEQPYVSISPKDIVAEKKNGELVAGPFTIKSNTGGEYTVEVKNTDKVSIITGDGTRKNTFRSGEQFYVNIPYNVDVRSVKLEVTAEASKEVARLYLTSLSGYQDMTALDVIPYGTIADDAIITYDLSGGIKVIKKGDDGKLIEGVKFNLLQDGNLIGSYVTDSNGVIEISGLWQGDYILQETESVPGYDIVNENTNITVKPDTTTTVEISNNKIYGYLELSKKDISDGKLIPNAEFIVRNESHEEVARGKTDEQGVAKFKLTYGKYTYQEFNAPEGYILDESEFSFEIKQNGEIVKAVMTNEKIKGKISIEKADKDNLDLKLKGAEFTIYDVNGKEVDKLVTDNDGKAISKEHIYGKYTMKETKAPKGYKASDKIYEIFISENGKVYEFSVENVIKAGKVSITKVDAEDKSKGIEGAEFTIYDLNRNHIETIVTNSDGIAKSKNLKFGKYIMKETKAPIGYILDETIHEIAVSEDEMLVELTLKNSKIYGELEITKADISDGKLLPNAEFIVRNEVGDEVVKGKTDENGLAKFKLPYGKYTYQEFNAPEGYVIDEGEYPFEIKENGEIVKAKMENEKIKGFVSIEKVDFDNRNKKLAGAQLTIYDDKDNVVEVLTTDAEGKALSKALEYGTYKMKETTAPEGYILGTEAIEIKITEHEKVYTYTIENKTPLIQTGGVDQTASLAIGTIMTSAAGYVLFKRNKK